MSGAVECVDWTGRYRARAMESPSPTPILTSSRVTSPGLASLERKGPSIDVSETAGPGPADAPTAPTRKQPVRPAELPPERRLSAATLAGLAAAAGITAIVLGGWAFVSGVGTDRGSDTGTSSTPSGFDQALTLLAKPNA